MEPTRTTSPFDDSEFDDPHFDRQYGLEPVSGDDRIFALVAHLSPLVGFGLLAPLVIYLLKKDTSAFVADQAKEALNFHITLVLAAIVSGILTIILVGLLMLLAVGVVAVVFAIVAAIKANEGERYRYPFALRLVK